MTLSREYVILGGGSRSSKIEIAPEALQLLPNAGIVEDLAPRARFLN